MSEFRPGGVVSGPPLEVLVEDDECILDRDGQCQRRDDRHHYAMVELRRLCDVEPTMVPGHCLHRHVEPVTSVVTNEVVARLCLACDAQLDP